MTPEQLITRFPELPWREPVEITYTAKRLNLLGGNAPPSLIGQKRWLCRFCLEAHGSRGPDMGFKSREEFQRHMEAAH